MLLTTKLCSLILVCLLISKASASDAFVDDDAIEAELQTLDTAYNMDLEEYFARINSLEEVVQTSTTKNKILWSKLKCWILHPKTHVEFESSILTATNFIAYATAQQAYEGLADLHTCRASLFFKQLNQDAALHDYENAIHFALLSKNDLTIGHAYYFKGRELLNINKLSAGLTALLSSKYYFESAGDLFWLHRSKMHIASSLSDIGDTSRSIIYLDELMEKVGNDEFEKAKLYGLYARNYQLDKRFSDALAMYKKQFLFYKEQAQWYDEAVLAALRLASLKIDRGEIKEARDLIDYTQENDSEISDTSIKLLSLKTEAKYEFARGNFTQAREYLTQYEATIQNSDDAFSDDLYHFQSQILEKLGDYEGATNALRRYLEVLDKKTYEARVNQTISLQVQYELSKKESQNRALLKETKHQKSTIASLQKLQKWHTALLGLGGVIIAILGLYIIRHQRTNSN